MSVWTEDRIAKLKQRWLDGLSTQSIADELGSGISKNAVIGKIHRLGLADKGGARERAPRAERQRREGTSSPRRTISKAAPSSLFPPRRHEVEPETDFELPETTHLGRDAVVGLVAQSCRWPIGDPRSEDFRFCGCSSSSDSPYCAHHRRLAYQPSDRRLRRVG